MADFDVAGARQAGYSDQEIAHYLAQQGHPESKITGVLGISAEPELSDTAAVASQKAGSYMRDPQAQQNVRALRSGQAQVQINPDRYRSPMPADRAGEAEPQEPSTLDRLKQVPTQHAIKALGGSTATELYDMGVDSAHTFIEKLLGEPWDSIKTHLPGVGWTADALARVVRKAPEVLDFLYTPMGAASAAGMGALPSAAKAGLEAGFATDLSQGAAKSIKAAAENPTGENVGEAIGSTAMAAAPVVHAGPELAAAGKEAIQSIPEPVRRTLADETGALKVTAGRKPPPVSLSAPGVRPPRASDEELARYEEEGYPEGFAVRQGAIGKGGAYFSTPGGSTYFDPSFPEKGHYDISKAKIAETTDPEVARSLVSETLKDKRLTGAERGRLQAELDNEDGPLIDYMLADETPMAAAGKRLGYDGMRVVENDDTPGTASSAFVWNTDAVKPWKQEAPAPHKFSGTQVNLPTHVASGIHLAAAQIPDDKLAKDGRETEPHITLKYRAGDDPAEIQKLLADEPPVRATLGKASLFSNDDADVLKVGVDSPDLHRLNAKIAEKFKHPDDYPEYKPHVTIAYLKPGEGRQYEGKAIPGVTGQDVTLPTVTYSGNDRSTTEIPLAGERGTVPPSSPEPEPKSGTASVRAPSDIEPYRAATAQQESEFHAAEEGRRGDRAIAERSRVLAPEREAIAQGVQKAFADKPGSEKVQRSLARDLEQQIRDRKAQFPTTGEFPFQPFEAKRVKIEFDKNGNPKPEIEYQPISYSFDAPVRGQKLWTRDKLTPMGEKVSDKLANQIVTEVQGIRQKGEDALRTPIEKRTPDEKTALRIAAQKNWYNRMRTQLRQMFGSAGDLFSDLLGATSAKTPVAPNYQQAAEALERFSKGHYDEALAPYLAYRGEGGKPNKYTGPLALRFGDKKYNANTMAVMEALIDRFREKPSPKTPNYAGNLIGSTDQATVDVWAARMLQRMRNQAYGDAPAVPAAAEGPVAGDRIVDPGGTVRNTGQFGFGQQVFLKAASQLGMKPHELQAFLWFAEKDLWTRKGLTSKVGEGGDMAAIARAENLHRIVTGIAPENATRAENAVSMMKPVENLAKMDPNVKSIVNSHAIGMWASPGGDQAGLPEHSAQFEVTVKGESPETVNAIAAHVIRAARENKQDDAFIAKTVPDDQASTDYARPGLSVYFNKPLSGEDAWKVIEPVRTENIGGFTLFGGPRAKPGEYLGMRFIFMPEYVHDSATLAKMKTSQIQALVEADRQRARQEMTNIVEQLGKDERIGHSLVEYYDVLNANKEDYGRLIEELENRAGRKASVAQGASTPGPWRKPIGESVARRAVARSRGSAGTGRREGSGPDESGSRPALTPPSATSRPPTSQ